MQIRHFASHPTHAKSARVGDPGCAPVWMTNVAYQQVDTLGLDCDV
jgi:hypothetical protein